MIVVADSNPLIGLAKGNVFIVLHELFGTIHLLPNVWHEVSVKGHNRPGAAEVAQAKADDWLQITAVPYTFNECDCDPIRSLHLLRPSFLRLMVRGRQFVAWKHRGSPTNIWPG